MELWDIIRNFAVRKDKRRDYDTKLYPIGIQTFERIRREGKVYIDKTADRYVMELKPDKSADAAMRQINLNEYNERFALSGKPITNVGINFDSEKGNIEEWKIE